LDDIPTAIEIDGSNNIFVAGSTMSSSTNSDYITIKDSANGTFLWSSIYDYVGFHDAAARLVLDYSGNVIVIGASGSGTTSWDYTTVAYSPITGGQLTVNRTSVPGLGFDQPSAIAKDNNGNIYITGVVDSNGFRDVNTVKLDSNLNLLWTRKYDGADHLEDVGKDIGIDSTGNIYITGYSRKSNGGTDFLTIKYDSSGSPVWHQNYQASDDTYTA
jgi:hypothetical protein